MRFFSWLFGKSVKSITKKKQELAPASRTLTTADYVQKLHYFETNRRKVRRVAFSPDGLQLLLCGEGSSVSLWEPETGKETRTIEGEYWDAAFSPDGHLAIAAGYEQVHLLDLTNGQQVRSFSGQTGLVTSVTCSPDGKHILAGSSDGPARLWDASNAKEIRCFRRSGVRFDMVAYSPDGKRILLAASEGLILLYDANSGARFRSFEPSGQVMCVVYSPNGRHVLSSGSRTYELVQIWDIETGKEVGKISVPASGGYHVPHMAVSCDGSRLITANLGGDVRLWDVTTSQCLVSFRMHPKVGVTCDSMAFSPHGKRFVTVDSYGAVWLWELKI